MANASRLLDLTEDEITDLIEREIEAKLSHSDITHIEELFGVNKERIRSAIQAAEARKSQVFQEISDTFSNNQSLIHRKLCVEFDYCNTKNSEEFWLITSVCDTIFMSLTVPLPATLVSAYIIKKGWLDRLCQC